MAGKASVQQPMGRVGPRRQVIIPQAIFEKLRMREGDVVAFTQRKNGVLIKPARRANPDDLLNVEETALVIKARREMREGKYISLSRLEHDLARKRSPRRRKTA